ncbi:MAG: M20/M25/M40 family metallo-hydrolase, partial [Gammaproteobacteria bacterium]
GTTQWDSAGPVDEIYLVGGPLVRYAEAAGAVSAEVFLHEPDDALARKYLTATAQYLEMYRNLIGPYPYTKFALVENFWETGYGMPSFTLLGPQIIRFPFILASSYPHEILHNWWGNSVFVDYASGNWCEGLTAYMADHLMQEQRGLGADYRRDTLKKYRDFVNESRDFPLTEFRSRHSAATEAVGYGKVLMGFHMLRRQLGDDGFRQAMARFYRTNRGRQASFNDVRTALENDSGHDFQAFFEQWVEWTGAPDIEVVDVTVVATADGYATTGRLLQTQGGAPYALDVPIYITTTDGLEVFTVTATGTDYGFLLRTSARPLLLEVDREFDLFRLLDPRETAPSIGQIFGEPEILAVLPSGSSREELQAWRELLDAWQSDAHSIAVTLDSELDTVPPGTAVWLLGSSNVVAARLFASEQTVDVSFGTDELIIAGTGVPLGNHSTVAVRRHPDDATKAIGWITVNPSAAFPGMATKLPHYGKYSYLAFEGDEPANMLKGQWDATDSPLRVDLRPQGDADMTPLPSTSPPQRAALAELPPVFSRDRLTEHVTALAGAEMQGRGLGTPGLELAADYIIEQFAAVGLVPGGDDGGWSQVFRVDEGEDGQPHDVRNIVGVLPGTDPSMAGQTVLVTAHYDHLGHGWPDERADAGRGAVYFGADDNASGVSVMIELARNLVNAGAPKRTIVFIAFTGEESGLQGSRYYANDLSAEELAGVFGVVNLDTVGRLGDKKISVFGAGSATEWPHVFRGIGFTTGIQSTAVTQDFAASDQQAFIDLGVPGVHISSGANLDYHRPTDTADKIDGDGLVKVAVFTKEAVGYLAARPEPLTVTIDDSPRAQIPVAGSGEGRRSVSVGTVPDFSFPGPGVRVDDVVPQSPAAKAGVRAGDILIELAGQSIGDLQGLTDVMKILEPGQIATMTVVRDGEKITREVELAAR